MRRFSSYGPINNEEHFHATREKLIEKAYSRLSGPNPKQGGHDITVWAPRQAGKTWTMQQILFRLRKDARFDVAKINLEHLKTCTDVDAIIEYIVKDLGEKLGKSLSITETRHFQEIFRKGVLDKPLILILDEFDALHEDAISAIVGAFRNIHISRLDEMDKPTGEKTYLLHAVALIGVRSVLGVENAKGSPFNVQRSLHIPNLTPEEVCGLFQWYEKESGHKVEPAVVDRLFYETRGQPGLTCWLGELLTEGFDDYTPDTSRPVNMKDFDRVFAAATYVLPNNNILNLISKVKEEPEKSLVLKLFHTAEPIEFRFDEPTLNGLYMHGVIDRELGGQGRYYTRFSSPFVQKRIFNYFSYTLFGAMDRLVEPFSSLEHVITPEKLEVRELLKLYQVYIEKNKAWLFKDVPRRHDLRVFEAVFHFSLYSYIERFLQTREGRVLPEFPTGNGKIDLLIRHGQSSYGIELKSFTDHASFRKALAQAARYGKQLGLKEIFLVTFVEGLDKKTRGTFETDVPDPETGVTVKPFFIETGVL